MNTARVDRLTHRIGIVSATIAFLWLLFWLAGSRDLKEHTGLSLLALAAGTQVAYWSARAVGWVIKGWAEPDARAEKPARSVTLTKPPMTGITVLGWALTQGVNGVIDATPNSRRGYGV